MNYNMVLTPEQWERLRPKMRAAGINYEPSGYGAMVYIGGRVALQSMISWPHG